MSKRESWYNREIWLYSCAIWELMPGWIWDKTQSQSRQNGTVVHKADQEI